MKTQTAASPRAGSARRTVKPLADICWDPPNAPTFEAATVPAADLETIMALASQAPSSFNLQPWRFVVVRDQSRREHLSRAACNHPSLRDAPVVIVAFGRRGEWRQTIDDIVHAEVEDGLLAAADVPQRRTQMLEAVSSVPIDVWLNRQVTVAFTYMMLAAQSLGWDAIPFENFDDAGVRGVLSLPDDAKVVALLALGRVERRRQRPGRLSLEQIYSAEQYGARWSYSEEDLESLWNHTETITRG